VKKEDWETSVARMIIKLFKGDVRKGKIVQLIATQTKTT
jgi:hypothetical protein